MSRRLVEVEQLDPDGFTPEVFISWAMANSIGHHIPRETPILIVDDLWIYALTFPLRSWPTDPPLWEQGRLGRWGGDDPRTPVKNLYARSRWRWYLLRTRPEAHGYTDPTDTEEDES